MNQMVTRVMQHTYVSVTNENGGIVPPWLQFPVHILPYPFPLPTSPDEVGPGVATPSLQVSVPCFDLSFVAMARVGARITTSAG